MSFWEMNSIKHCCEYKYILDPILEYMHHKKI